MPLHNTSYSPATVTSIHLTMAVECGKLRSIAGQNRGHEATGRRPSDEADAEQQWSHAERQKRRLDTENVYSGSNMANARYITKARRTREANGSKEREGTREKQTG